MSSIKEMVSNGKVASFTHYKQNELWYVTECGFEFPVPIDDAGDGTFHNAERAMLLMRYIRKHLEAIETARTESEAIQYVCPPQLEGAKNGDPKWWNNMVGDNPTQQEFERRCSIATFY